METLKNRNSPVVAKMLSQLQVLKGEKGDTGEKGYTPIKGVDYFTDNEIESIIRYIQSFVKDGVDGIQGPKGDRGRDGVDGKTPDTNKIVKEVMSKVRNGKDGVSPNVKEVAKEAVALINTNPDQEFVTLKQLTEFLRRGGFRGGAGTTTSTTGAFTTVTVTPTPDDTTLVYTASSAITAVNVNGSIYIDGTSAMGGTISISGVTITLPNPVGSTGFIFGIV